jgi:two-component system sensor histidine kinase KdpD
LIALRELALRQVAEQVDRSLETYMADKEIQKNWAVRERIAVCVSASPDAQYLIARAARMARRLDAELMVIHVDNTSERADDGHKSLDANLQFATNLGAQIVRVKSWSVADAVAQIVREKHITHVIFGRSADKGWKKYLYLSAAHRFLRESPEVDVHIVTQERD